MFAVKLHELETKKIRKDQETGGILKTINLDNIRPNPYQPRKLFDSEEIFKLSKSIKQYGLIQPITVRMIGEDNYELVAGERRFRACRLAGMTEIHAYVIEVQEQKSAVMALIENVQRENLHFFEEAMAIGMLIREHKLTQEKVSLSLGKKQSTIANKLRLLKLDKDVMDMIIKYDLTERHARALLKLEQAPLQKMIIETVYQKGLNVKRTEELIDSVLNGTVKKPKSHTSKFICDNRIYINSVKAVYNSIKERGVKTDFNINEEDDKIVMSIIINK